MKVKSKITSKLIAPCGMNCGICVGHLRDKNKCLGCREMSEGKPSGCKKCSIVHCEILKENKMAFCSNKCEKYPCRRLKNLDQRYRKKYGMSMLDNLDSINESGIRKFVKVENEKWKCGSCADPLCVHRSACLKCEAPNKYFPGK